MKEGFERVTVDTLGGLCTLMDPSDLPLGVASYASNVEFFPGGFRSRDGFKAYLADSGGVTGGFRSVYDHVDGIGTRHHITYQGGIGRIGSRTTGSTVDTVVTKTGSSGSAFTTMRSTSLYGRVYSCVSDGKKGLMAPVQWDGIQSVSAVGATGAYTPAQITFSGVGAFTTGRYFVIIAYETNTGYITGTTKLTYSSVAAFSANLLDITGIPIGPANIAKRRIFISLVDSFELFNPPGLVINDNTTTSLTGISLTAAQIAAGLPFSSYIDLQPPTAHLGVESYANRLVMWGGNGGIKPFYGPMSNSVTPPYSSIGLLNLDFNAMAAASYDFNVGGAHGEWETPATTTRVTVVAGSAAQGEPGNYLRIISAGTGELSVGQGNNVFTSRPNVDILSNYYLAPGRRYGLRARIRCTAYGGVGASAMGILLSEATGSTPGTTIASLALNLSSIDDDWAIYESDGSTTVTAKANVSLKVFLNASASSGDTIEVSKIEIYDLEGKRGSSRLDISRVDDVESYDLRTGVLDVSPNDGQEIRNVFALKGNLYINKEYSTYVTQDTGQEPDTWSVEIVSPTVGTPSVHGVGMGESWVAIVSRDGLYMFDGGSMEKISQEIQPTWDLFNWNKGEQMYCAVDTAKQTIVVGGPTASGRQQLRMSYVGGFGNPLQGNGQGRAWSIDSPKLVHAAPIRLDDGSGTIAYCTGGTITGNAGDTSTSPSVVYEDSTVTADWNANITASYRTAPIGSEMERSMFGGVAGKIRGIGTLTVKLVRPDASTPASATWSRTLSANPLHDVEVRAHQTDTQLAIQVDSVASTGSYYYVKRLAAWLKKSPSASIRGY